MKTLSPIAVSLTLILLLSSACAVSEPSPITSAPPTKAEPTQSLPSTEIPGASVRLTILYDNTTEDPRLAVEWGFSALVEYEGNTVLFDT